MRWSSSQPENEWHSLLGGVLVDLCWSLRRSFQVRRFFVRSVLLKSDNMTILYPSFPCGDLLEEERFHFLKRFTRGLWEAKEYVDEHCDTEAAEDNVDLPLDVDKGGGDTTLQSV